VARLQNHNGVVIEVHGVQVGFARRDQGQAERDRMNEIANAKFAPGDKVRIA
jgi:hypothetical protein